MAESYSALGAWFEYLNADCDYSTWSQYLLNKLKNAGNFSTGLDVGCGNGYFTRALNRAGYTVAGVDVSAQMLTVAREKAAKEGIKCEFLLGDITKLKVCGKVDFCTAVNDCINYVPPEKLQKAFSKVYSALKSGGVFLFDISSENKIKNVLSDNLFGVVNDDISYLWFNGQFDGGVKMDLTFFVRQNGDLYKRYDETHIQYAYSEETIISSLKSVGFARVEAEGLFGSPDKSERIHFTAYK